MMLKFTGFSVVSCFSICLTPLRVSDWPWFIFTSCYMALLLKIQDLKVQLTIRVSIPFPSAPHLNHPPITNPESSFFSLDLAPVHLFPPPTCQNTASHPVLWIPAPTLLLPI